MNVDETSDDDDEVDIEEYEKRLRQLNVRRRDVDTKSSDDESEAGLPFLHHFRVLRFRKSRRTFWLFDFRRRRRVYNESLGEEKTRVLWS